MASLLRLLLTRWASLLPPEREQPSQLQLLLQELAPPPAACAGKAEGEAEEAEEEAGEAEEAGGAAEAEEAAAAQELLSRCWETWPPLLDTLYSLSPLPGESKGRQP